MYSFLAEVQNVWGAVPSIVAFLELISTDKDHSEAVVIAACGLIGYVPVLNSFLFLFVAIEHGAS